MRKKTLTITLLVSACIVSLAAPVKSMLGADGADNMPETDDWENPYITDGLIAQWDGICNAGPGSHDANGGLVEILSRTPTYLRRGAFTVEEDCLSCSGAVIASPPLKSILDLDGSGNLTIEMCVSNPNGMGRCVNWGSGRPFSSEMCWSNRDYYMVHSACTASSLHSTWSTGFGNSRGVRTLVIGTDTVSWFVNGQQNSSALRTKDFEVRNNDFSIFGIDWSAVLPQDGDFCSVRVYSRALTPEEIEYNYAVDSLRFNLP